MTPRTMRRASPWWESRWLLVLLFLFLSGVPVFRTTARSPEVSRESGQSRVPQIPLTCGSERWAVKTLSDDDAPHIKLDKTVRVTITDLNRLPHRCQGGPDKRVWSEEFTVYEVVGRVKEVRAESDRDYHVVLADPDHAEFTIIVEIPDPACSGAADSPHVDTLTRARSSFQSLLRSGKSTDPKPLIGELVRVRGVGFYDFDHGQSGRSQSCIELHPVISIEAATP